MPVLKRPGEARRGQVVLSQDEAWELMTEHRPAGHGGGLRRQGPGAVASQALARAPAGDHRQRSLGRRRPPAGPGPLVGGVRRRRARPRRRSPQLASQARPLIRSHGKWVELDRADLAEAAAALAERASTDAAHRRRGAPVRHRAGGVAARRWVQRRRLRLGRRPARPAPSELSTEPITSPEGFDGELRSYQGEAVAWLGFLDSVELGGCLALDMGLGKTPTMLAHIARTAGSGPALVVAPPAVVGNWAAEAARFTPGLQGRRAPRRRHGPPPTSSEPRSPTPTSSSRPTAPPSATSRRSRRSRGTAWCSTRRRRSRTPPTRPPSSCGASPHGSGVALTGTPIENGLGDLWSILDFTNPGLVGSRTSFIAALSAGSRRLAPGRRDRTPGAQRHPRVPTHQVRADRGRRAARAHRPARPLHHDTRADRPVPGGARQPGRSRPRTRRWAPEPRKGAILAAITALKQICNHPAAYQDDGRPLPGRSGKLTRLEEIVDAVFAAGERVLVFTHFATLGCASGRAPHRPHRNARRLLPRRTGPGRARPDHR